MSLHVYVAREGFKDNPIGIDEWERAALQCDELKLRERSPGPFGKRVATLRDDARTYLSRTPYGLIHAQNPPIEMIRVLFKLAEALGAGVYSEDLERYSSVEDWEQRTAQHRRTLEQRREIARRKRRGRTIALLVVMLLGAVVGIVSAVWPRR